MLLSTLRIGFNKTAYSHSVRDEVTNQVLHQFKGHSSLLGMQFFVDLFACKGSVHFHYKLPRIRKSFAKRSLQKALERVWFKFLMSPSEHELRILDAIIQKCEGLDAHKKAALMSPFDPTLATVASPILPQFKCLPSFKWEFYSTQVDSDHLPWL